jgi:membrane protein DedA with SNARE-associated domain
MDRLVHSSFGDSCDDSMRRWTRNILIVFLLIFPVVLLSLTYLEDIAETNEQSGTQAITFITSLPRQAIEVASAAGYIGIFCLMLLEAAALPIPSEIILPFAGYLVFKGKLSFWPVILVSTIAALLGSFIDYYLGRRLGTSLLTDESRLPYVNVYHLSRVRAWFNRYGPTAVALFRLVPAARVLISFPAGAYRMNRPRFAVYTLLGCFPWNLILVYLGWSLGSSWEDIVAAFKYINLTVYALLIILAVWIGLKLLSRRKHK